MTYDEIHPTLRAFLAAHEAYRKLGFQSKDIFCIVAKNGCGVLSAFANLMTQGKQFSIECGPTQEEFDSAHERVTKAVVDGSVSAETLDRIWLESGPFSNAFDLAALIALKGFQIPGSLN